MDNNKPYKQKKWKKFKKAMKKAGRWTLKNLLPVTISIAAGGLGLPVALGGLASELFKKFSDANVKIPISEETFQDKLEELCKGEGKPIEYLQEKIEGANEDMDPKDVKLVVERIMTPVVYEMNTMLEIMRDEKADLQDILAGWLEDQSHLVLDQSQLIQNEMLNQFQHMDLKQTQILENINNIQSKMQFELVNFKRELSELIQAQFGQNDTPFNLDSMFNLATVHFTHQNLASRFDQPYNPDLYVRPELFFRSMGKFLSDFRDPMKKNIPIFLLLAHLGMGKTWNLAYITEYLLIERDIAIPIFINLKDGFEQQLYGIFKTKNMKEIVERCQKIKSESGLPIFLILDGLDEIIVEEMRDSLLILKQLLSQRTDALCVALSCRITAWVQDQQILNERRFFELHVWPDIQCSDWKSQFDIATPISCVLGEFSDSDLDIAIERYGLEKQYLSPGLYEISHQPYILRLVSEFIGLNNIYPSPENPESMASLFYTDDREAEKNTIMYRMGIHGNILDLFSQVIEAFPSANSELSPDQSKEFVNNPYFRPILYSGIILRARRQMRSVYQINPVYVPLLSLSFPHLSEKDSQHLETQRNSSNHSSSAKKYDYVYNHPDIRREELENNQIVNYRSEKILKREKDALLELEKMAGLIPIVSTIESETFGVMIVNNRVVGLGLYNTGLTALPESIGQLTTLDKLNISNNQLDSLPETMEQLTELKELWISNNKLIKMPDSRPTQQLFKKFNLTPGKLASISGNIGQMAPFKNLQGISDQMFASETVKNILKTLESKGCTIHY